MTLYPFHTGLHVCEHQSSWGQHGRDHQHHGVWTQHKTSGTGQGYKTYLQTTLNSNNAHHYYFWDQHNAISRLWAMVRTCMGSRYCSLDFRGAEVSRLVWKIVATTAPVKPVSLNRWSLNRITAFLGTYNHETGTIYNTVRVACTNHAPCWKMVGSP